MTVTTDTALAFYARIGAALFPMPYGSKAPTGIVGSFALDCSRDPAAWSAWRAAHPQCNFGIVAGPSGLIIMDTDAKEDRNAAWAARCALLAEWGLDAATHPPHVQSARGGWHDIFQVPAGVDARALRQPDALKGVINVRAGNGFVVAAGSYYDGTARGEASGAYILLAPDQAPHPAPAALIEHCTRRAPRATSSAARIGKWDMADVTALYTWLADAGAFEAYEDWLLAGMVARVEFGDAGLALWELTHDDTVTPDVTESKWDSFADTAEPGGVALGTLLQRAHALGWKGTVRPSTASMFGAVAAIAQAAGATLAGAPAAVGGLPMLAGQEELARVGEPILADFLANTLDVPHSPLAADFPTLPDGCSGHGLFAPLKETIARVLAMAEAPKWKAARVVDALAVLSLVHVETFDAVVRRIRTTGCTVPDSKIKLAATSLADKVERAFVKNDDWIYDSKGLPEADNSDNVEVYFGILSLSLRWNAWLERMEIYGGTDPTLRFPDWTYVDDTVVAKLRTRGNRTKTRFRPGKEFFYESILSIAHANTVDPALDRLTELQDAWDGVLRLDTWLTRACGVPDDPYHRAVSRNIIGGMVRRLRNPGCKHDTMPVFFGYQGAGKSTLAAILADMGQSSLDELMRSAGKWFTDSILLGDASKELVLSLAGKGVVEIGEMGMRGAANPNHVKAMISRQVDAGRTAYARAVAERPRRNIFIGTTNDDSPLVDPTGNRRFLPVHAAGEIDLVWLHANIGQLVGEAVRQEATGETFALPRDMWADAAERQEAARQESDVETLLNEWFTETPHTGLAYITAADLVHLSNLAGWRHTTARAYAMKQLGFRAETPYLLGKKTRVWLRGQVVKPIHIEQMAVRYMVGVDQQHRPTVTIRAGSGAGDALPPSPGVQLPPVPR